MYCKNCGSNLPEGFRYCSSCGVSANMGSTFCASCGRPVPQPAGPICPNCNGATGQPYPGYNPSKSKLTAGLLGIFLGMFGVHNFYLGYTGKAVAQLLITLLSCFILCFVPLIWGMIEGVMLLTDKITVDGRGYPLSE